jgi:NADP-dependent 3-hydroxy acid dehydrogenase YdfG
MSRRLEGRVALVTGASSGIGEATAKVLARDGCHLVLASRRLERLQVLAAALCSDEGRGEMLPVELDVTQPASIEDGVRMAIERFGGIDILVNNAGFGKMDALERLDPDADIRRQVEVNLLGVIWMTGAVLPGMLARRSGHIINMGSLAGHIGTPHYSIYAATKFGVRGFSEALRREVSPHGIRVSVIYPGGVRTGFAREGGGLRRWGLRTPRGLVLTPEAVGEAVARVAVRPRRAVVLPWVMAPILWANMLAPGVLDALMARVMTRRRPPPAG